MKISGVLTIRYRFCQDAIAGSGRRVVVLTVSVSIIPTKGEAKPLLFCLSSNCMYFVYILYSAHHDKFYVGQTNDLEDRLKRHNSGQVEAIKSYLHWEMLIRIEKETRSEAMVL